MKKILSLMCMAVSLTAMANPVSQEKASQIAKQFLQQNGRRASLSSAAAPVMTRGGQDAPYYIFNAGNEEGFVIVSGDDRTPQILGYAEKGSFNNAHIPASLKAMLDGYAIQIAKLKEATPAHKTLNAPAIEPLLTSKWDQGFPFNKQCPTTPEGEETWTGCVATAMAQVMYYYKWPAKTTQIIPGYTSWSWGFEIGDTDITTIDWNNMLPVYDATSTDAQDDAVATLMHLCDAALQIDFGPTFSGGGTPSIPPALVKYFDYDNSMKSVGRDSYKLSDWNQLIYNELAEGRPVVYNGSSAGGAHAFVVCGYKSDDLFYINWGWSGWCDGYFLLSVLDPGSTAGAGASTSSDGYSFWQGAIIGIQPQKGTVPEPARLTTANAYAGSYSYEGDEYKEFPLDNQEINLSDEGYRMFLWSENSHSNSQEIFDFTWGLFNETGELVTTLKIWDGEKFGDYIIVANDRSVLEDMTLEGSIPAGTYTIKPVSRLSGTETWFANTGTDKFYVTITIANGIAKLKNASNEPTVTPVFKLSGGTIEAVGDIFVNKPITVKATIENQGTDFIGDVFFFANGSLMSGSCIEVEAGKTIDVEFTFTPVEIGEVQLALSRDHDYGSEPFAEGKITVVAPKASLHSESSIVNAHDDIIFTRQAKLKIQLSNTADTEFDDKIWVELYKLVDGQPNFIGSKELEVKLAAGESKEIEHVISEGLESGYIYDVRIVYASEDQYVLSNDPLKFSVVWIPADLALTPSVKNATNDVVTDTKAIINLQATNNSNIDYNNDLVVYVYKLRNDGSNTGDYVGEARQWLSLAAGTSSNVELEFSSLEDGAIYFFWSYYYSEGNEVAGSEDTPVFLFKYDESTGITSVIGKANGTVCRIYSTDGRLLDTIRDGEVEQALKRLPKNIYILKPADGSSASKKIRN